jgi:hypothetical protein
MSATRTQIYLTKEQRRKLDARMRRESKTLAQIVREAVDRYLEDELVNPREALDSTFGAAPGIEVPSRSEWDRGYG